MELKCTNGFSDENGRRAGVTTGVIETCWFDSSLAQ